MQTRFLKYAFLNEEDLDEFKKEAQRPSAGAVLFLLENSQYCDTFTATFLALATTQPMTLIHTRMSRLCKKYNGQIQIVNSKEADELYRHNLKLLEK